MDDKADRNDEGAFEDSSNPSGEAEFGAAAIKPSIPTRRAVRDALLAAMKDRTTPDVALFAGSPDPVRLTREFFDIVADHRDQAGPVARWQRIESCLQTWTREGLVADSDETDGSTAPRSESAQATEPGPIEAPIEGRDGRRSAAFQAAGSADLRLRRLGLHIDQKGRLASSKLGRPRFGQIPEALAVRIARMSAKGGDGTVVAIIIAISLDWNWERPLIVSWKTLSTVAALVGVRPQTVLEAYKKLEGWGILRRATEEDRLVLKRANVQLPSHSQIIIWVLQLPEAWTPWDDREGYVRAMNA